MTILRDDQDGLIVVFENSDLACSELRLEGVVD